MLKTRDKKVFKRILLMFCLVLTLGVCCRPVTAQAAWIDRSETGIYFEDTGGEGIGQGIGDIDEDDAPEELERDEGQTFFDNLMENGILSFLTKIGMLLFDLIDSIGASLDTLIYGRLVTENTLFTFDLGRGNVYGIVGSAVYGIMATVVFVLLIPVLTGKVAISAWKRGDSARIGLQDALSSFVISVLLITLMPYILDVMIFLRDGSLYLLGTEAATSLFGMDSSTSIIGMFAAAATQDLLTAFLFIASVLLNLYFLIAYVGVALSMTANYMLFPFVVLKMSFDKQILKNWIFEVISCLLVPLIDALLIMVPVLIGRLGSDIEGVEIVQLIVCYMIIPARSYARGVFGLRTSALENSGLAAASFLGMSAARKIKDGFSESRNAKKNAEADRERANREDDMAQLEKEKEQADFQASRQEEKAAAMPTADDIKNAANGNNADDMPDELKNKLNDKYPLGEEQTYAKGAEAHLNSQEDDISSMPLPKEATLSSEERQKNASRLDTLNDEKEQLEAGKNALEEQRKAILDDQDLTTEEKAQKLAELDKNIDTMDRDLDNVNKERNSLMSVDDKLKETLKHKKALEDEWEEVNNNDSIPESEKDIKLNSLNDQIKEADREIESLQRQKQRINLEQEREALAKEPATLRKEFANLQDSKEVLEQEREHLVRQRNSLQEEQAHYAVGTSKHEELGNGIQRLNEQITAKDQEISDNVIQQNTVAGALKKQEAGLYDRQAYNLNERVKAQAAYDKAKSEADFCQKRLDEANAKGAESGFKGRMSREEKKLLENNLENAKGNMEKAEERIASLSAEDRKIAQRIRETAPEQPAYTMDDLRKAKSAQAVKRAGLQKEIADLQYKMEGEGGDKAAYKSQIAKLHSEVADCNYKSARIDQMMEGLGGGSKTGQKSFSSASAGAGGGGLNSVSDEYERKRAAIMERYANVDNFESPEFKNISREKRAQLYRERALRPQKVLTSRRVAGAAGALAGGMAGIWLGSAGVASGSIIGSAVGSELGENVALRSLNRTSSKPTDYSDKPIDFKVLADVRDVTAAEDRRTLERVQAQLRTSLESQSFQDNFTQELMSNDLIRNEAKVLFKKYGVTKENYTAKREQMLPELHRKTIRAVENAEARVIEKCAGEEYAKLSNDVKQKVIEKVGKPNDAVFFSMAEDLYMREKWQDSYERYLKDD